MCGDGTIPSPFNRALIPLTPASIQKKSTLKFPVEKCQRNTFLSRGLAVTSQNICSLHTPARGILSDLPPTLLPKLPSHIKSNPPATFLLLLALQQMALSLQTMCPFRNSVLPSTSSSKVSTAPHDLPPQQIPHGAAQICIAPAAERSEKKKKTKTLRVDSHKLRTGGGEGKRRIRIGQFTFMQCLSNCPHSS